jgi:small subunit ribosomal protein S20
MANTKSAAKRARQSVKRTARNATVLSGLKSAQKKIRAALAAGKPEEAKATFASYASALDKAAKRGIVHKNLVNRKKGTLSRALARTSA